MARLTFRIKWWNFTFIPCDTNVRRGTWLTSVFSRTTALRQDRSIKNGLQIEIRKYFIAILLRST